MEALSARHCSTRSKKEGLSAFRFSRQLQVKSVRLRHLVLYYKDMRGRLRRSKRGRLKLGYGPGGPLVLATGDPLNLLNKLVGLGCLSEKQITNALRSKVIFSSVDEGAQTCVRDIYISSLSTADGQQDACQKAEEQACDYKSHQKTLSQLCPGKAESIDHRWIENRKAVVVDNPDR